MKTLYKSLLDIDNAQEYIKTLGDHAHELLSQWVCIDGFQFGWSAHISDKDWWNIFDIQFLMNYYQKHYDADITWMGAECYKGIQTGCYAYDKYPRTGNRGENFIYYIRAALIYSILSAKTDGEFNTDKIEKRIRLFLNKENNSVNDTIIEFKEIKGSQISQGGNDIDKSGESEWIITIRNSRLFPAGDRYCRPLTLTFMSKRLIRSIWGNRK